MNHDLSDSVRPALFRSVLCSSWNAYQEPETAGSSESREQPAVRDRARRAMDLAVAWAECRIAQVCWSDEVCPAFFPIAVIE